MLPRRLHFPRRLVATLASFTLALSGVLIVVAPPASATPTTRAFTPVFTASTTGDVTIRGNTLETCLAGSVQAQGSITCAAAQGGASQQNNNYFMTYVDADGTSGGNTTFDSSSANVTVPAGATVLYAGLSWGAVTSAGSLTGYPALTGVAAPDGTKKGNALFQAPGASDYSPVTSTTTDINSGNYQAYADVTNTVKAAGSGTYTVANVQAGTGGGNYAGWSLAVAYSDPNAPLRNLTVFTGYNQVSGSTPSVDIPVSGFLTPATGAVTTNVGVVAYEGDKGSVGDGLSIGSTALYNSLNPINDVFNSSITDLNVAVTDRTPSYANTLGFDIDRLDATGALANGSTSTVLHYTTANPGGETYYPGMLTFATNLSASALTATKSVTDFTSGGSVVSRNDRLDYSITVTNGGGDGAAATVLTDAVPAGTTYKSGTLTINGTSVSDTTGDDTGDVVAGNVTARLGTGATSSAGGVLAPAASVTVTFSVTVNSNSTATDGTALPNTALFTNKDVTTGTGYSGGSNTVTSYVVVPPSLGGTLAGGELTAPYSSGFTVSNGTGPYVWTLSSGTLPAGLAINASTGLITGTPTAAGSFPITVQVTDANSRSATRSQTINVNAVPVVTFTPPPGEVTVAYSAQPTVSGGTSPYTWSVSVGALPAGLTMNSSTGLISGTPTAAAVGTTNITVQAVDASNVSAIKAVSIVIVAAPALTFSAPPAGEVTAPYSNQLTYTGGVSPYTWSVSTGSLPAGLTLNASTGLVSGTPTTAASSTFTVKIVDSNNLSDTRSATLVIGSGPTVTFSPPTGEATVAFSAQPTASGGTSPYTWSVSVGNLPAGLTISPSTGRISGTPTAAGTTNITVQAVDANFGSATSAVSIVIVAAPTVTFTPAAGEAGAAYSAQPTVSGGTSPYTWSVSAGTLPDGLTISPSTGLISGTPTTAGTANITVQVVDANSVVATKNVAIVIGLGPSVTFAPAAGEATVAYSAQPTVTGGTNPYTWSISAGTLPDGLTISPSTGLISGTPTAAAVGTANITVQAVDAKNVAATKDVAIVIVAVPSVTFTPPAGEAGAAYSAQPTVSGGTSPYTWSISAGTLPDGLTISPSTGLISGTPTTAGTANITVQVVDANSVVATKNVAIVIGLGPTVTFTPGAGEARAAYSAQPTVSGGTSPYTWSISAGTLPDGLTISPSTGLISGTPNAAAVGTTNITVRAHDANGVNATKVADIVIVAAPALTFSAPPTGVVAAAYSDQLTFTGGVASFTWSVSAGSLPTGLTLNAGTGLLSGTPTADGSFDFTVKIVDGNGVFDTKDATVVIAKTTTAITLSAPASVTFGTSVTLSAAVSPTAAGGTVTFTDVPTTGPQAGTTVIIGSDTLTSGAASVHVTLPAFGMNTITARYAGDSTHAAADSSTAQVEVSAYVGEVIVSEFRGSGPSGPADSYVELYNTGPTVPLAGFVVTETSGAISTLPSDAGLLGTGRSYLLTGRSFSLWPFGTFDYSTTLGTGGIEVLAPDTALTQTDAVGPASGFHRGTGLLDVGTATLAQYAWVRTERAGAEVNTGNNAADFALVSVQGGLVGPVQSMVGAASPTGTQDPFQNNAGLTSTLLDPGVPASAAPNRVITTGSNRDLIVRRTITNTSATTVTLAQVRVSALSEVNGLPEPGVTSQPARVAQLVVVNPAAPTEMVTVSGGPAVTVHDLSVDAPTANSGGFNSTLAVPLPGVGLAPGASINVAFTFAIGIGTHGTFWFGYDVESLTGVTGNSRPNFQHSAAHRSSRPTRRGKPGDAGRIR